MYQCETGSRFYIRQASCVEIFFRQFERFIFNFEIVCPTRLTTTWLPEFPLDDIIIRAPGTLAWCKPGRASVTLGTPIQSVSQVVVVPP